uniref:SAS-6 centriolar assembly protein n=1 Tax=Petromyzon marinus TaxID=7757 RepID=S4RVQ4_PETMA
QQRRLFCSAVSLLLRAKDCDDRRTDIRVTVELQSVASPILKKDLTVRLTDDTDPFFLYSLNLGDEDFQSLKSQQGLLVDFTSFPQKFIDLLQLCIQEQDKDVPRYVVMMAYCVDGRVHLLACVQRVFFMSVGEDVGLFEQVRMCIFIVKNENAALETRLQKTEEDLTKRLAYAQQKTFAFSCIDYSRLLLIIASLIILLVSPGQHPTSPCLSLVPASAVEEEGRRRHEEERRELEAEQRRLRSQLQQRTSQAEASARDAAERHRAADTALRDARTRIGALEEESARVQQEAASLRRESGAHESERRDADAALVALRSRVSSLEQEARDKEQLVQRMGQALDTTRQQQKKLEESLDEKQTQGGKLETTIKSLSEELLKANDIIKRLQAELKAQAGKVRLKNAVTTQQEKLLAERDAGLQRERQETAELRIALCNKEEQAAKLSEQLEATVEKLEESKQLLKTNENVISWLNKQLNENQGTGVGGRAGARERQRDDDAALVYRPCHPAQPPATSVRQKHMTMGLGSPLTGIPMRNFTVKHSLAPRWSPQAHHCWRRLLTEAVGGYSLSQRRPPFLPSLAESETLPPSSQPVIKLSLSDPVGLDAKYLQRRDGSIPVRGVTGGDLAGLAMTRPMAPKPGPPPLSSYFPATATTTQQQQLHLQQSAS